MTTREEAIYEFQDVLGELRDEIEITENLKNACRLAIQTLEQEPKTGHWKLVYCEYGTVFYLCSRCNEGRAIIDGDNYKSLDEFKICPYCGARMIENNENQKNMTRKELWDKAGSNQHITRKDVGVRYPNNNSLGQSYREGFTLS